MDINYFSNKTSEGEKLLENNTEYRKIIGSLLYIATVTRPDTSAAVSILSRKVSNPRLKDWNAVLRILRYLKHTASKQIILSADANLQLTGYTDADWASNTEYRKSTCGYVFQLSRSTISWCSKKLNCIALSSAEAELISATNSIQECQWLQKLLKDFIRNSLANHNIRGQSICDSPPNVNKSNILH